MNYPRMHLSYYVSSLDQAVDFYNSFFGKPADKLKKDYAKYDLNSPNMVFSIIESPEKVKQDFGHMGVVVETEQEFERFRSTAREQGLNFKEEMCSTCCYARQDKVWVSDPDGYEWEVYLFHEDLENESVLDTMEEYALCCTPAALQAKESVNVQFKSNQDAMNTRDCGCGPGCC
jgi:catechol 2,3-dioxygenase-like lactoylglutathione lyase family enzyme